MNIQTNIFRVHVDTGKLIYSKPWDDVYASSMNYDPNTGLIYGIGFVVENKTQIQPLIYRFLRQKIVTILVLTSWAASGPSCWNWKDGLHFMTQQQLLTKKLELFTLLLQQETICLSIYWAPMLTLEKQYHKAKVVLQIYQTVQWAFTFSTNKCLLILNDCISTLFKLRESNFYHRFNLFSTPTLACILVSSVETSMTAVSSN